MHETHDFLELIDTPTAPCHYQPLLTHMDHNSLDSIAPNVTNTIAPYNLPHELPPQASDQPPEYLHDVHYQQVFTLALPQSSSKESELLKW